MERRTFLAAAIGAAATVASARIALADATPPPPPEPPFHRRGEVGSARNLARVRRHLEKMIDFLQHDQTDYGGHRVNAINDLIAARRELDLALQYDAQHPH